VEHQLLVALKRFGTFGNAAAIGCIARHFEISGNIGQHWRPAIWTISWCVEGSVEQYTDRCIAAILAHEQQIVTWPTQEERCQISARIRDESDFPFCIGFIDGTLFPFENKPSLDGEDWYNRKGRYGMAALIMCDDRKRIRYVYTGWTGCTHDQRVYDNSTIARRPEQFFSPSQYLLADSGYSPRPHVIPAFKRSPCRGLNAMESAFNRKLSNIRVRVEHCIGMLKAKFSSLRGLRLAIRNDREVHRCTYWIRACAALHNLLLKDPVDAEWMGAEDEDTDNENPWEGGVGVGRDLAVEGRRRRQWLMGLVLR
jgi:hypothetical protein